MAKRNTPTDASPKSSTATIALTAATEGERRTPPEGMQKQEPNIPLIPSSLILSTFHLLAPCKGRIYDTAFGFCGNSSLFCAA